MNIYNFHSNPEKLIQIATEFTKEVSGKDAEFFYKHGLVDYENPIEVINGDLDLEDSAYEHGLDFYEFDASVVNGNLRFSGGSLPPNITVNGNYIGLDTYIVHENITITGNADLTNTTDFIEEFGDNVTIGGDLLMNGVDVIALGDNLTVGGNLNLLGSSIADLPKDLKVGGYLIITDTTLNPSNLPTTIQVGKKIISKDGDI